MKKLFYFLIAIITLTAGLGLLTYHLATAQGVQTTSNTLTIFNWGEYIDPALLTKFEKETGYHVNYMTFDGNEDMYVKVKQGGTAYDIIVPSEYMVQKMASEGLLVKLDHTKITGLSNDNPTLLNPEFDSGNNYSVPYFWGTLGIVYNDQYIKNPPKKWADLWATKYKDSILLTDQVRDVMGIGLIATNASINSTKSKEVNNAYQKLLQLTPNIKAVLGDEILNYMMSGEASMAVVYSGQAEEMTSSNPHLHYVIPQTTNIWYDNLAIPKTCKNLKAAYAFINFMQEPKNAAQNADYVGYSTPNEKALRLLPNTVRDDKEYYPNNDIIKNDESYTSLPPYWTNAYNDLYLQFKMNK